MASDGWQPLYKLAITPGRPVPEVVAAKLRELIDDKTFKPGSRLPNESELARSMGVARSSIRTALQRLESQGVVEVRRGVGWHVRRIVDLGLEQAAQLVLGGHHTIPDLFEVRIGLEGLAASLAAVRATEGEIDDIAKMNTEHAESRDDRVELLRTDIEFHDAIVRAARNGLLLETYQQIVRELTDWRYHSYSDRSEALRSYREHARVIRFIRNHDPGGARAAMNAHLHRLYDGLPDIGDEPLDST